MALMACRECGREIADRAKACPQCGAPTRVRIYKGRLSPTVTLVLLLIFGGLIFWGALSHTLK